MSRARITSCYKCEDRHPGCHSTCEKYIQQKEEHDKMLEDVKDAKIRNNSYISSPKKRGGKKQQKVKERQR